MGVLAAALGTPLQPWQQYVADVGGERLDGGRYRYPIVIVSVPRQAGKTVGARVSQVHRAVARPDRVVFYTAQNGIKARRRWLDTVRAVEASPLGRFVEVKRGAGASEIAFPNRSVIAPFAPTPDSLHSETPHRVDLDECWAYDPQQGDDLMTAIKPAQLTLRDRQIWLYSTAGNETSAWLWSWVLIGRAAAADPDAKVAYFEWSIPDDADPYDLDTVAAHHPAIGSLITVEDLADAAAAHPKPDAYARSYGNRWPRTGSASPIDADIWAARADRDLELPRGPRAVAFGYDTAEHASETAIVAAWRDQLGRACVSLVEHGDGSGWLDSTLDDLIELHQPVDYGADGRGPARAITERLARRGLDPTELSTADYTTACATFLGAVMGADDAGLVHDAADPLNRAAAAAVTRAVGESWVWERRAATIPLVALTAATVALRLYDHPRKRSLPVPRASVRLAS